MCSLLEKKMKFLFDDKFMQAFEALKKNLIEALTLTSPNLELPFEQMCDASDVVVGSLLRKRKEHVFHTIYYASKTLKLLNNTNEKF